jgi:glycosyltransferase involved in cell wall biosynthesis
VPTHNREGFLEDALGSCYAAADSRVGRVQIVVVDDGSNDGTRDLLARHSGRVDAILLERNAGAAAARNVGLQHARGRYVKFLDSDDILVPGALAEEIVLADEQGADMVLSGWGTVRLDSGRRPMTRTEKHYPAPDLRPIMDALLQGRACPTSAVLYRRQYLEGLQWDQNASPLDDWDWFCRAALRMGTIVSLARTSYWMREHDAPRVTSAARMAEVARAHHVVLGKLEEWLRVHEELTPARARRLAQYYYKQLRVLCVHDRPAFEKAVAHILELDLRFLPREEEPQLLMRCLATLFGVRRAVMGHTLIRRAVGPLFSLSAATASRRDSRGSGEGERPRSRDAEWRQTH